MQRPERIVVFGLYKTGTTAVFQKISNHLPGDTRLLFEKRAYVAEATDSYTGVLAKTILGHDPALQEGLSSFEPFEKKVLLVRDPRDWLISGTLFLVHTKASIYADQARARLIQDIIAEKEKNPESLPLMTVIEAISRAEPATDIDGMCDWATRTLSFVQDFHAQQPQAHLLHYEDFVDGNYSGLARYLQLPLDNEAPRLEGWQQHVSRTKTHGNWRDWFTATDVDFFRPLLGPFLTHFDYDQSWTLSSHPRIEAEHASGYVERLLAMREAER